MGKEVEEGVSKTPARDSCCPKTMKPSQNLVQQEKGSAPKKDVKEGKKDTCPTQGEQGVGDTMTQGTPSASTP
jgi:hypothetical protein